MYAGRGGGAGVAEAAAGDDAGAAAGSAGGLHPATSAAHPSAQQTHGNSPIDLVMGKTPSCECPWKQRCFRARRLSHLTAPLRELSDNWSAVHSLRYGVLVKPALHFSILLTALSLAPGAHARGGQSEQKRIELSATAGARFGGSLDVGLEGADDLSSDDGKLSFDDSVSYGGILGFRMQKNGLAFLSYSRQETTARFRLFADDSSKKTASASIEYFQVGGNLEVTRGRVTPYFGLSIGPARFASLESDGADAWFFSAALDGGVKVELLPFLYLRVLGRLPVTFQSSSVYCYTGYGCLVALHGQPLVQGEVQGGVTLAF